jgi:exopolyphosphatase/guanosine-5'-triphosphate,3'-diphosphate pyrophosphatase
MPTRKRTAAPVKVIETPAPAPPAGQPAASGAEVVAVIDMGASAIRLVVAEVRPGAPIAIVEEASRGVLLGKDTFTSGKLGPATVEATLKAIEGFRRIMDTYGVIRYRAVATSAVREAQNRDSFLDRIRLRTGLEVEVIDGSEENRLTYLAVRERLRGHPAFTAGRTLLVEIGGGSADLSFLVDGEPIHSGIYALGSIRMRQVLGSWRGGHEQSIRLLRRHIHNVVDDIRNEMPLAEARYFIALGGDVRFAAHLLLGSDAAEEVSPLIPKAPFVAFCDHVSGFDQDQLLEKYRLRQAEAETLVPALLAYRELLLETAAEGIIVPSASLRDGLLADMGRTEDHGIVDFSRQVLASAHALGEKYRYDAPHARKVAQLATRIFDEVRSEHGLSDRHRLLLEVAALLHDIGNFVNLRGHHKHSQYLLSVSEIFGLTQDDMAIVGNIARYHRRASPQRSHLPFMALDRQTRVDVNKLAAILRLANALDADHLQKVTDVRIVSEDGNWVLQVEGAGDLTMERLATLARSDLVGDVFGRRVSFQEVGVRA